MALEARSENEIVLKDESLEGEIKRLEEESSKIVENDISEMNHGTIFARLDDYFDGAQISEIKSKIIRIGSVAGLVGTLGASLVGCKSNTDVYVKENTSTKIPIVETVAIPKETKTPENIINVSKERESAYEDLDLSDVERWTDFAPEKIEKVEKTIQTTKDTEIILIPVQYDYFYDKGRTPSVLKFEEGRNLEIKDIYYLRGEAGNIVRFSVLPNIMGSRNVPIIFLDNGHMEDGEYVIDGKNYTENTSAKIFSEFSYIAGKENEVYAPEIVNLLTAMEEITKRQEEMGPFRKGEEYSFIDVSNLRKSPNYIGGNETERIKVRGEGISAGATLLSNSLYELGSRLNIPWEDIETERFANQYMFFNSPYGANDFLIDTRVELIDTAVFREFDLKWIQPVDAYIKVDISIIPNDPRFSDTEIPGFNERSGAELILTISLTDTDPGNQSEKIREMISAYERYYKSAREEESPLLFENGFVKNIGWEDISYKVIREFVYPEEKIKYFTEEMETSESLRQIRELQNAINDLPHSFSGGLGEYLKTTTWYENYQDKERIEAVLDTLNYTNVEGQPLQCVGFVSLLSHLGYEGLTFQSVGGAHSFGSGKKPARTALELIPYALIENEYAEISATGYGGIALGSKDISIEDYEIGDLFVRSGMIGGRFNGETPDGKPIVFYAGHVGAIVGKKVVDGKTVLLVADSNRGNDGKIKIYEVTEENFYVIFGNPDVKKFIIRRSTN